MKPVRHMGRLFDLEAYRDISTPVCRIRPMITVAAKIAAMEGGTAAMLTSSGQAANFLALFNICECGRPYRSVFFYLWRNFQPDCSDYEKDGNYSDIRISGCYRRGTECGIPAEIQELMFGETIANPALTVLDIELFAKVAHAHGCTADRG